MQYKEAMTHALSVSWKASICHSGEACWCRIIEPVEPLTDDTGEEIYISHSGALSQEHAEYIVGLHNASINNKSSEV